MGHPIHIGISTCPNDTFAFDALMRNLVDTRGLDFHFELLDIQQLNDALRAGRFDVVKTSFHAALLLADQLRVLPSGSALGFGVGPLLLAARDGAVPRDSSQRTLCPGIDTTATLLIRIFYPSTTQIDHVVFSQIMPDLKSGKADFGVCIHEGRFTWQNEGLHLVEDLGQRWERETKCPLPLGGLVARRSLDDELTGRIQACIADSIGWGLSHRDETLPTMRRHAQEFDDAVLMQHVDLYVNDWTVDLGTVGRQALATLSTLARRSGIVGHDAPPIEVFESTDARPALPAKD
ncbi:1,4-dihydroxy-6-naphthoate synthase [Crateriforma conspicua]|uniref:1,4-dihydroxy-6-naphtoate synthase n=1 Tax=Crateriforma conspicua TaxID=2527996 RepID=A0A5C5YAT9_9PLAN|nr:1,4-dihydroxy-6-naphthoate synthase [Crateriforma conspicua]QDV61796.1 1,4-dihydroxy-6-naphtoate synthase [Crateriforma conspicua]TWT71953.1 1,4-dihydroxy-6-naphtoate synthase [Crateriforma conspicua]